MIQKYGIKAEHPLSPLELELTAFRLGLDEDSGGLGKPEHFWNICHLLWGAKFVRHPWAERIIELACEHRYLAVHGCASSGKSNTVAIWGLVNWLCDPENTMVIYTSTTIAGAKKRIWAYVKKMFLSAQGMPGKLIDSLCNIKTINDQGVAPNEQAGLMLLAGDQKNLKEAMGKFIGLKCPRVFLMGDELPELSEAVVEACISNLSKNPYFQLIGIGNFKTIYDPLGVLATPKDGYSSITVNDYEWETKLGYALRLDGTKSPAVTGDPSQYPNWLYNRHMYEEDIRTMGEKSASFWRMCRSFPCPEAESNCIYSEADFIKGSTTDKTIWLGEPTPVGAFDPGFTTDGDRFIFIHGLYGQDRNGIWTLEFGNVIPIIENVEITAMGEARDLQTARLVSEKAKELHIAMPNLGGDASGPGGLAFASIMSLFWSSLFLQIKFQETASDMQVSEVDNRKGFEAFTNKRSEMWFQGRDFIRSGQIKNLPSEVAKELKSVQYSTIKTGDYLRIKLESKKDIKKRIGRSPDCADAALMLIHLCRERFGFIAGNTVKVARQQNMSWINRVNKAHSVYDPELAFLGH